MRSEYAFMLGVAAWTVLSGSAELLTFTPKVSSGGQWTWASAENWLTVSGGNKVPAEGDDLLVDTPANNYHAANAGAYVNSIRITKNALPYSGVSYAGFYLKEGGAGLVVEHTDAKSAYSTLSLDGDVTVDIAGDYWWQGGVKGRTSTRKSRITKIGAAKLSLDKIANADWTGATIREGSILLKTDSGVAGIDFHFDGLAATAKLVLGGNLVLKDGGLSSTTDLPTANHGVYDDSSSRSLTISGTPKSANLYFAGGFHQKVSFVFAPSEPSCTFTAARAASTTTGDLTVSNGTFRVAEGASFAKLTRLYVKDQGVLSIASDAGAVTPGYIELMDGSVSVDAGTVWELPKLFRNGAAVADGDYTAATCDWVTGEGTVRVNHRKNYVNPIFLDVASDATMSVEEALTVYNAAHEGESVSVESLNGGADASRTLVKTGTGLLKMDRAMPNFTGEVHIEAGVLRTEVRYSIGKESNANAPVYVYSGATMYTLTTNSNMNVGRTVHIAGTGASGYQGALQCGNTFSGNYHLYNVFGGKIILDDNASARVGTWIEVADQLTLNGHTFTVIGNNGSNNDSPFHLRTVTDNGHIVVQNAEWRDEPRVTFNGSDPNNSVTMKNRGGFRFTSNSLTFDGSGVNAWKLHFEGPNNVFYGDYHVAARDSGNNRLIVPAILDTMVSLYYQGDRRRGSLFFNAPLSGSGGLKTEGGRNMFLHLFNPGNTFAGGLTFDRGIIWAYPNGAVPAKGAVTLQPASATYNVTGNSNNNLNFQNYFDGIAFMQPDTYTLPELVSKGAFPARVQNGQGAWTKVTQNGVGGLEYYTELGAPLLEVEKGCVKLPRGAAAGLWEGTNVCADAAAAKAAYEGTATYTNLAVRGPTSALQMEGYNYTSWKPKECITYTGYVWNRGAADATWTLASALQNGSVTVKIDGQPVLTADASKLVSANVTLAPGPHAFEYRAYCGNTAAAPYAPTGWASKFGFVYDVQGRNDTSSTANFQQCVDTGDGALFTRTADTSAHLPAFGEMKFDVGTSLDVNGNAYTAARVRGWPTVTSSATDASANPSFAILDKLVVDGADLAANRTMTVQMPFSFGETGGILVTNLATTTHGRYTIARTTDAAGIDFGSADFTRSRVEIDARNWLVYLSTDGKELILEYSAGTMLIFR